MIATWPSHDDLHLVLRSSDYRAESAATPFLTSLETSRHVLSLTVKRTHLAAFRALAVALCNYIGHGWYLREMCHLHQLLLQIAGKRLPQAYGLLHSSSRLDLI